MEYVNTPIYAGQTGTSLCNAAGACLPYGSFSTLEEELSILENEFSVEVADTRETLEEAYRVRYEAYCVERQYESSDTGLEVDEFDHRSYHVILRHRPTAQAVGTVRLVPSRAETGGHDLPIGRFCAPGLLDHLPRRTTAEISRFTVSKRLRGTAGHSTLLTRIGLMRGIMQVSHAYGLTHWCAVMERPLLRLLGRTGIHFHPMGPVVEHRGLRQPAYGSIGRILARAYREDPAVWDFATLGGRLAHSAESALPRHSPRPPQNHRRPHGQDMMLLPRRPARG